MMDNINQADDEITPMQYSTQGLEAIRKSTPPSSIEQEAEAYVKDCEMLTDLFDRFMPKQIAVDDPKHLAMYEAFHRIKGLQQRLASAHSVPESVKGGIKWVKATDRLPEPYRQKYIKNGANWDLGHYDPTKDDFCCLGGWSKRKDLIQWLDESAESTPPQPTGDVKILLDVLRELVDLKETKDSVAFLLNGAIKADYEKRKPLAWQKARDALSSYQSFQNKES